MSDLLTISDLDETITDKVYTQDYSPKKIIEGVKIIPIVKHVSEDGDFSELIRISENGEVEQLPGFKLTQINRSKLIPGAIKAWHFHLRQDELWAIAAGWLFVGLWDLRKNSPTKGFTQRIILGGGKSNLLFIPKGVAHGCANFSKKGAQLLYFLNQKFDPTNPDEQRIPWDSKGADFWTPEKD